MAENTDALPRIGTNLIRRGKGVVVGSIATGLVVGGIVSEITTHNSSPSPARETETATHLRLEGKYQIGQPINLGMVYEVNVANGFDAEGNLVEPTVTVFLEDGSTMEVSFDDPRLGPTQREAVRGQLFIEPGNYEGGRITNHEYEGNIARFFGLPNDLKTSFGAIKVGQNETPRAVYLIPSERFFNLDGREFPIGYPLYNTPPHPSVGSVPPTLV